MASSGTLRVKVVGDTAPFQKSMKGLSKNVGRAAKNIAKVGAAGFAAAGAAAVTGAFKVAEFGDEIAKSSQKAGLGVEQFQELRFAFGQGGVEAATFDTALQKFNKRLGESATTGGTADDAFEALGVSLRDADGNVRDAGGAMDEVLPKLADIESDAERAAVAGDLFGQRAGPELAAALSDGVDGIDDAREKAQELGIVMGEDAAESAEKFTDQWDDIKQSTLGLLRTGLTPVMGMLSDKVFPFIQNTAIPALKDFRDWLGPRLEEAASRISKFFHTSVVPAFEALSAWWGQNGPAIISAAQQLWEGLQGAFEGISAAIQTVIGWFQSSDSEATGAFSSIQSFAAETFPQLVEIVTSAVGAIRAVIERVTAIVTTIWEKWGDGILSYIATAWKAIQKVISGALDIIQGIFEVFAGLFSGDWSRMWDGIKQILSGAWQVIQGIVQQGVNLITTITDAAMSFLQGLWDRTWEAIARSLSNRIQDVKDTISGVVSFVRTIPSRIASAARGMWDSISDGFRSMINQVIDWWNQLSFTVPKIDMPGPYNFEGATVGTPDIPRLHAGGIFRAPTAGGEGLALLRDGERVSTPAQDRNSTGTMGMLVAAIRELAARPNVVQIDGREIARSQPMREEQDRIARRHSRNTAS